MNWYEVEEYVASNRRASSLKTALRHAMQAKVDELFKSEKDSDQEDSDVFGY